MPQISSYREALARLRAGNDRFVSNVRSIDAIASQGQRAALVAGQAPFAIVLSCSDSRVPAEIVFDCGLGELFVVRVAGNIVAPSGLGSVEFAVATFGTPLVVVMGHTHCGAIAATVDAIKNDGLVPTNSIRSIVDRVAPSITELVRAGATEPDLRGAVRANVRASANQLRHGSRLLEESIVEERLLVVGALYELETGRVDFFDGL
ncbi:MAG TPA: carbonic anhydrase [Nannocystaceae bacterium]|nr:carbonic anhydrase [Nannocystaceae bacterium]